jgi:uncharacterized Fe-S cluster-containing radical SAM superfamily protein
MKAYPRYVTRPWTPYDPLRLARLTEKLVCQNDRRKYTAFYATGVYGGIATGYTIGCCLRCLVCWGGIGRDFPERYGKFYSPREVCERLERVARSYGTRRARISGGAEPTIGKAHLLGLLEHIEKSPVIDLFILETNGIILGADADYARQIAQFKKPHVRVSLKAGTPEGFEHRTGAVGRFYELPFTAIKNLLRYGASCHAAAMTDRRLMSAEERHRLIQKLEAIAPFLAARLEEEVVDPYRTTLFRMRQAGIDVKRFFEEKKPIY